MMSFNKRTLLAPSGQYIGPGTKLSGHFDEQPNSNAQEAARQHDYQQQEVSEKTNKVLSYIQYNKADKNLIINSIANIEKDIKGAHLESLAGDVAELALAQTKLAFSKSPLGEGLKLITGDPEEIEVHPAPKIINKKLLHGTAIQHRYHRRR